MKVLITGANGFIAKNLRVTLNKMPQIEVLEYFKNDTIEKLDSLIKEADFVFHLAGVNRPEKVDDYYDGNSNFTQILIDIIERNNKKVPILLSSSTQVGNGSDYAKSKEEAEKIIEKYAIKNDISCFIYRLPNVFGKWSKPNYNSVISTWCHNISHNQEIQINDEKVELNLVYVDDVVKSFIEQLKVQEIKDYYVEVKITYRKTLREIRDLLFSFRENRESLIIPNVASGFERALYATYLSYLSTDDFSYVLKGHKDDRGTFYEILKTLDSGQFSLSTTAPGITRGNHYHHTKNEKFLVVKGEALIEFRHIVTNEIISYEVSDKKMEIVEMIPGYTHNIKNTGNEEMILILWANETFDQNNPDTYFLEVRNDK